MTVSKVLKLADGAWYESGKGIDDFAVCTEKVWQFFDTDAKRIQLSLHGTKREAGVDSVSVRCTKDFLVYVNGRSVHALLSFRQWLLEELGTNRTSYLCVWEIL